MPGPRRKRLSLPYEPQTAIGGPGGIALDEDGDLLFAAMFSPVIRRLDAQSGRVSTAGPR